MCVSLWMCAWLCAETQWEPRVAVISHQQQLLAGARSPRHLCPATGELLVRQLHSKPNLQLQLRAGGAVVCGGVRAGAGGRVGVGQAGAA